jgi:gp32 DNA binding protein like
MGTFEEVQKQYEKNKNAASGSKFASQEERQKKYFTTVLPKGSTGEDRRVRILPTKEGVSPFVEVWFHEVQVDGKWVKLYDPKQEGKHSPLNEVHDSLMATGEESDKKLANAYRARRFYIVKLIDRDNEADGPKFWRFKHNSKQEGIFDKIFPIFRTKGDITDPLKGRDLVLSLSLTTSNAGKEYTTINSIIPDDVSPLSTNEEQAQKWINDTLVWSDVYSKKPEEYLEMVANGETPKWDQDTKKWISNAQAEATVGGPQVPIPEDSQENEPPEEDLPF